MAFPAWFASSVHGPAATIDTVEPETVQTEVVAELNAVTAKPDVLVADTVNGAAPKVCVGIADMEIACDPCVMVSVCVAELADPVKYAA